jgi:hypothetical protein
MSIIDRRIPGPLNQFPVSGSSGGGGGGGSLTINNNTEGNMLMATGGADEISGINVFKYDDSSNTISGSGQIKAHSFAFEGTNQDGDNVLYKMMVEGGILQLLSSSLT